MEDITGVHEMTNTQLKRLIQKIEVDKDGNVDIYLRLIGDLGLDETILIDEEATIPNRHPPYIKSRQNAFLWQYFTFCFLELFKIL